MLNQAQIIGHLGSDPETRYMPSGSAVTNFTVATSRKWKDKNSGEQKEATEWHRVAVFGKLAEICAEWLRKGAQVYISGELRTRKWEKDGQNHYSTEIIANEMKMLGKKQGDGRPAPLATGGTQQPSSRPDTGNGAPNPGDFDDDIPF